MLHLLLELRTDNIYETGKIPNRMIPARPDEDYDLLVGELIVRFIERVNRDDRIKQRLELASDLEELTYNFATGKEGSEEELIKYVKEGLEAI